MNCHEFQDCLQELLDGHPVQDRPAFDWHRTTCADCGEWFAAAVAMDRGLSALPLLCVPVSAWDKIVGQLLRDSRAEASRRRLRLAAASAAFALVGGLLAWNRGSVPDDRRPAPVTVAAGRPSPFPQGAALAVSPPTVNQSLAEAGSALASLVTRTADETVGSGRLLIPEKVDPPLSIATTDAWQQALETTPQALREAGQGVSAGLEPVADSARRAVTVFFQEIPTVGDVH